MSIAPHTGIVDFGTFTAPTASTDGIQGEVPQPLAGQEGYVLTGTGWASAGSVGLVGYQGTWNALTNTPTLTSSVGVQGYYYVVDVAGTTNLNGITDWQVGDWAIFNGSIWQKVDNTDSYDPANVAITGGTINGTTLGATTPAAGTVTTFAVAGSLQNLFLQSQTFNTSPWSNAALTINQTATTAPNATSTGNSLIPTAVSTIHRISQTQSITSGVTYTASVYAKANGYNYLFMNFGAGFNASTTFNISTGTVSTTGQGTATITSAGSGWYRCTATGTATVTQIATVFFQVNSTQTGATDDTFTGNGTSGIFLWGAQLETSLTVHTYQVTTTSASSANPVISLAGGGSIGLESTGSLYVQPAGTGALQAQATTSSATGGNARGANAVDWQTSRSAAGQVASSSYSVISGGQQNAVSGANSGIVSGLANTISGGGAYSFVGTGYANTASNAYSFVGGGDVNTASGQRAAIVNGSSNTAAGWFNFIGSGYQNSGTAFAAVTTQSATMNGTTAVTLSGSNASIKVGQYISGTSIAFNTYVAAISGTSLTLSQAASGSSTSTLSFFTPHGVVVGGGNNQATGSYSFIGGGGDAGTASNRNVASGDWSVVAGGLKSVASGQYAFVGGGSGAIASGAYAVVSGGVNNQATGFGSTSIGGYNNISNSAYSATLGGNFASTRGIEGISVFGSQTPLGGTLALAQSSLLVLAVQTTDATATVLRSNASAASTNNQIILPNNAAFAFKGTVIANVTGAANGASWSFEGAIMRGANAASTVLMGTPAINRVAATAGATAWAIAITADTTNGGLAVTVTGAASTTIRWVCKAETCEVTF